MTTGVDIGYRGPRDGRRIARNLPSADEDPDCISADLEKEIRAGRMIGPFTRHPPPTPFFLCSPVGSVAKRNTSERRRIHHLSHPHGSSVNDSTDPIALSYARFDDALWMVSRLGRGALLCKVDVAKAFRIVGLRREDRPLVGVCWYDRLYFDAALPFGLKSSPGIWHRYASLLHWTFTHVGGIRDCVFYVDDYLIGGAAGTDQCMRSKRIALSIMDAAGVPWSRDKDEREGTPTTFLVFLGVGIDTVAMQCRLSIERQAELRALLDEWLTKRSCTIKELQSLIGKLTFAARMVRAARSFVRRLIDCLRCGRQARAAHGRARSHGSGSSTRGGLMTLHLPQWMFDDLRWWDRFITRWNGVSFIHQSWSSPAVARLYTDASEIGYGAVCAERWMSVRWSGAHFAIARSAGGKRHSTTWLELFAVLSALTSLAPVALANRRVLIFCDNEAAVAIIASGTSRAPALMDLLRAILLVAATHAIDIRAQHIAGTANTVADALSRLQVAFFLESHPNCSHSPTTPLPPPLHHW